MSRDGALPRRWYSAGRVTDIPRGSSILLETDAGVSVAVWRLEDDRVFATDDLCSHYFWSLHGAGTLSGTEIICFGHEARFDVTTGAALCPPARQPLSTYELAVDRHGQIQVFA